MGLKESAKILALYMLTLALLSATIPLHTIIHDHQFVHIENSSDQRDQHLKIYNKPCCTVSDAIFTADLPPKKQSFLLERTANVIKHFYRLDNYFQFYHHTRNKAPPIAV